MLLDVFIYSLITLAIVSLIRSYLASYLFTDMILEWLQKKGWLLIHYGITCDKCLSAWVVAGICWPSPILILPTYGLVLLWLAVYNYGKED